MHAIIKTCGIAAALLAAHGVGQAAAIPVNKTNSVPAELDAGFSTTRSVTVGPADIPGGSGTVNDVDITIDFGKCDDPYDETFATCVAPGFSFNREIVFCLTSPAGTIVDLVSEDTYSGQEPGTRVTVTFDDAAATMVGGPLLLSGIFSPIGDLSDFIGENAVGTWDLFAQDTVTGLLPVLWTPR